MTRPAKTLREAAHDLTLMSDDGSEYEHNDGCQGEPDCPACWVEGIRQLFVDFPQETAPVAVGERVAQVLDTHYYDASWSREHRGFRCVCGWLGDSHVQHVTDMLAAAVFRDEATVKAEAIRELAQAQRQLAADARTSNGRAEHEDRADWLDEQANALGGIPDSDPTKAAIDVIARELTEQMLDPMDLGDMWDDYPEIGEDDWRSIVARARDRAEAAKPDTETYKAAYAHLQARAEAWAEENDPA